MSEVNEFDREEYERRKRAIFESMSKRGQQRILKMGYENWDPFIEPKDPRERLISSPAQRATRILVEFYETSEFKDVARSYHRELFELARGFIQGETRSRIIFSFCEWCLSKLKEDEGK